MDSQSLQKTFLRNPEEAWPRGMRRGRPGGPGGPEDTESHHPPLWVSGCIKYCSDASLMNSSGAQISSSVLHPKSLRGFLAFETGELFLPWQDRREVDCRPMFWTRSCNCSETVAGISVTVPNRWCDQLHTHRNTAVVCTHHHLRRCLRPRRRCQPRRRR
jgi:hypothetical protein